MHTGTMARSDSAHGGVPRRGRRQDTVGATNVQQGWRRVKAARGVARLPAMRSAHGDHLPFRGATTGHRNAGNRRTLGASRQVRRFARRHRPTRGFPAPDGDAGGVPAGASSMAHAYGCRGRHTSRAAWRAGRGGPYPAAHADRRLLTRRAGASALAPRAQAIRARLPGCAPRCRPDVSGGLAVAPGQSPWAPPNWSAKMLSLALSLARVMSTSVASQRRVPVISRKKPRSSEWMLIPWPGTA